MDEVGLRLWDVGVVPRLAEGAQPSDGPLGRDASARSHVDRRELASKLAHPSEVRAIGDATPSVLEPTTRQGPAGSPAKPRVGATRSGPNAGLREFNPGRANDRPVSGDRFGAFSKTVAYDGWQRSLFPVEWFDSRPERTVTDAVDDDPGVACWVRLHIGELPILWNSGGQQYNPDFIVIDADATHWVVEVKMDKEISSDDVKAKRDAARRWANYVNADETAVVPWRYLLVSEADVETARGSWSALKKLGGE